MRCPVGGRVQASPLRPARKQPDAIPHPQGTARPRPTAPGSSPARCSSRCWSRRSPAPPARATTLRGGARNPSSDARQAYTKETQIIANLSTYGTRQSNKSTNGGGAIYGCRSGAGGTPKGNEPCVRASNLEDGRAFEFDSNSGTEVGRITGPADGRAVHDERDRRRHRPERRQGRRQGRDRHRRDARERSPTSRAAGALGAERGAEAASVAGAAGTYTVDVRRATSASARSPRPITGDGPRRERHDDAPPTPTTVAVHTLDSAGTADRPAVPPGRHLLSRLTTRSGPPLSPRGSRPRARARASARAASPSRRRRRRGGRPGR